MTRLAPSEAPSFVDERAKRFGRVVIAATNPAKWELQIERTHERTATNALCVDCRGPCRHRAP